MEEDLGRATEAGFSDFTWASTMEYLDFLSLDLLTRWVIVVKIFSGPDLGNCREFTLMLQLSTIKFLVKATSVIFLLGVGSYVCYKLYHQYKRRSRPPPAFKPPVITSWVSRELLDSCLAQNEEECSVKIQRRETVYHRKMGQHSSKTPHLYYEPVAYNIHSGVNLLGHSSSSGGGGGSALYTSPCIQTTFRKCQLRGDYDSKKHVVDQQSDNLNNDQRLRRPTTLPLNVVRHAADGIDDHRPLFIDRDVCNRSGGSDSGESLRDVDSIASSEGVLDGDDEEDDDGFRHSDFRFNCRLHPGGGGCEEDDRFSRSGSMKGNFSPGSLMNRHLVLSPTDDRLPPDGKASADCTPADCRLRPTHWPVSEDEDSELFSNSENEQRDSFDYAAAPVSLVDQSPYSPNHQQRPRLMRDQSFGSEFSDLSVDAAAFDKVGISTVEAIDRLQEEIDSVKRDCVELETCMGHVDGHGPTPQVYTALVCAHALSDISECSDVGGILAGECSFSERGLSHRGDQLVPPGSGRSNRTNGLTYKRSRDSSFETSASSSFMVNSSAVSLEWDSMPCAATPTIHNGSSATNNSSSSSGGDVTGESNPCSHSNNYHSGTPRGPAETRTRSLRRSSANGLPKKSTPNGNCTSTPGMTVVDSGSDFGTPLTNGSPEPYGRGGRLRSESIVSLEWDEEFNRSVAATGDQSFGEDLVFAAPQPSEVSAAEEMDTLPTTVSQEFFSDSNRGRNMISGLVGRRRSIGIGGGPERNNMWSSIESGYIDEFSCDSKQVTPQSADDSERTSSLSRHHRRRLLHLPLCNRRRGSSEDDNRRTVSVSRVRDPIVDSAYCEGNDLLEDVRTWPVIGEKQSADNTIMSTKGVSKDFINACHQLEIQHVRAIHSDYYCALRAVLVQTLAHGFSPLEHSGGLDKIKRQLSLWVRCHHNWLAKWNFARKLNYDEKTCLDGMLNCLQSLDWLTSCVLSSTNKESQATQMLNSDPDLDVQAMEAIKLLMVLSAIELKESIVNDKPVPVFALLLFARESSPEAYLTKHLNHVGSSQTVDKMDFFLLGYALGLTICLLHPMSTENEDLVSYFPDYNLGSWPQIYLVSGRSKQNDDREQYSIILR